MNIYTKINAMWDKICCLAADVATLNNNSSVPPNISNNKMLFETVDSYYSAEIVPTVPGEKIGDTARIKTLKDFIYVNFTWNGTTWVKEFHEWNPYNEIYWNENLYSSPVLHGGELNNGDIYTNEYGVGILTSSEWTPIGAAYIIANSHGTLYLHWDGTNVIFDGYQSNETVPEGGTDGQILAKIDGDDYNTEWIDPPTGGLSGEAYIFVAADSADPLVNGAALVAAYEAAKLLTPYGSALSATNRYTILMGDGIYDTVVQFTINAQYIDFQSLSGKQVTFLQSISIEGNDVKVCDINCLGNAIIINGDFPLLYIKNCTGGAGSFGGTGGTFSGIADNCIGGEASFGAGGTFSGTAKNCTGGYASFGGGGGTFTGTAKNCTGGDASFAAGGTFSGTAESCTGGDLSFGGNNGIFSGTAKNCTGGEFSFAGGDSGTFSGIAESCIGGEASFGGVNILSGKLFSCRLTSGTFTTVSGGGRTYYCIDGNGNTNNQ